MLDARQPKFDFDIPGDENLGTKHAFIEHLKQFDRIGRKTEIITSEGLSYYINDYWTAAQRKSNSLHEISYRACFKAELPAFFIHELSEPEDTVYDPFSGRGTMALQAALMGRNPIANDINPLSEILLSPRLIPPQLSDVAVRLEQINWEQKCDLDEELLAFFHPETLQEICALKLYLLKKPDLDNVDKWIRMVAINRLTGHSPGFFSVYTMPPNQAVSIKRQLKINEKRAHPPYARR